MIFRVRDTATHSTHNSSNNIYIKWNQIAHFGTCVLAAAPLLLPLASVASQVAKVQSGWHHQQLLHVVQIDSRVGCSMKLGAPDDEQNAQVKSTCPSDLHTLRDVLALGWGSVTSRFPGSNIPALFFCESLYLPAIGPASDDDARAPLLKRLEVRGKIFSEIGKVQSFFQHLFSFFLLLLLLLCVLPSSFGLSLYVVRRYTQFSSRRLRRRPSALIFNILSHTLDVLGTLLTIHMRKSRRSSRQNATQFELCVWQNKSEQRLGTKPY